MQWLSGIAFSTFYKRDRYWTTRALKALGGVEAFKTLQLKFRRLLLASRMGEKLIRERTVDFTVHETAFKMFDPFLSYTHEEKGAAYEPAVTAHLKSILHNRKCCFLDIGSYLGFYTAYVGKMNPRATVFAFEPNHEYYQTTLENIKINRINGRAFHVALSETNQAETICDRSMIIKKGRYAESVNGISFDTLAEQQKIIPDVVKIDVNGSEGKVLHGMKRALAKHVRQLYLELHPIDLIAGGYSLKQIIDIISQSGFTIFEMKQFRHRQQPLFVLIDQNTYPQLVNPDQWTAVEIKDRRMLFATKQPEDIPAT